MTQTLLAIENLSVGFRHQQTVRTVVNDVCLLYTSDAADEL